MDASDWYMMGQAMQSFNNTLANNANVVMASNTDREDRNFSREMSDLAWQRNLEMWKMQNEYNLPVNQYQRQLEGLTVNGLNPNLVYGSSSSVTGAAGAPAPYKFEGYHSTAVPRFGQIEPIQSLLSTRLLQTQVAAQEAQNRYINARADNEELRSPGIRAKSDESAARWNYILDHMSDQEQAWRAEQALSYWKGQQSFSTAEILKNKASMSYYEAAMAEYLNTEKVPGTNYTFQQYLERYKATLPAAQFERMKAECLDIASRIAYRAKQGQLLDLKKEYQGYVNQFAKYGRAIGNDTISTLISSLMWFWDQFKGDDSVPGNPTLDDWLQNQTKLPPGM